MVERPIRQVAVRVDKRPKFALVPLFTFTNSSSALTKCPFAGLTSSFIELLVVGIKRMPVAVSTGRCSGVVLTGRKPSRAAHSAPPPSPWIMVNWPQYSGTSAHSWLLMRRPWRCLADGVPDCAAAATLLDIVTEAKRYQGKALIAHINRAVNLVIRPTPGAWVGAREVLTFADGDCKDYSIAKHFALHEAGGPPERVRLVIVITDVRKITWSSRCMTKMLGSYWITRR